MSDHIYMLRSLFVGRSFVRSDSIGVLYACVRAECVYVIIFTCSVVFYFTYTVAVTWFGLSFFQCSMLNFCVSGIFVVFFLLLFRVAT